LEDRTGSATKEAVNDRDEDQTAHKPQNGRGDDGDQDLVQTAPKDNIGTSIGDGCPHQPSNKTVCFAYGDAIAVGEEAPGHGSGKPCSHHSQRDSLGVHNAFGDHLGHGGAC
jgi:hypothetical protein